MLPYEKLKIENNNEENSDISDLNNNIKISNIILDVEWTEFDLKERSLIETDFNNALIILRNKLLNNISKFNNIEININIDPERKNKIEEQYKFYMDSKRLKADEFVDKILNENKDLNKKQIEE